MSAIVEREQPVELMAAQQLEEAAKFLDLEPWIVRRLRQCEREVTVNLEVIREGGEAPSAYDGQQFATEPLAARPDLLVISQARLRQAHEEGSHQVERLRL